MEVSLFGYPAYGPWDILRHVFEDLCEVNSQLFLTINHIQVLLIISISQTINQFCGSFQNL